LHIKSFVVSPVASNCYVVATSPDKGSPAVVIDPGDIELDAVFNYIREMAFDVQAVWLTHAHFDHVLGVDLVRDKYGVKALVHSDDLALWDGLQETVRKWMGQEVTALRAPDGFIADGDVVSLGSNKFRVWHTPGHSPGSVCFVSDEIAFTGDTLFAGSIGRADLPLSDGQAMQLSLQKLMQLPDTLQLYPGHMQPTTMQRERASNPFLQNI